MSAPASSRRGRRPLLVITGAVLGLGLAGGLTGTALGAIGGSDGPPPPGAGHHRHGPPVPGQDGGRAGPADDGPAGPADRLEPPDQT